MSIDESINTVGERLSTAKREVVEFFDGKFVEQYRQIPDEIVKMQESELSKNFTPTTNDFLIRKKIWKLVKERRQSGVEDKLSTSDIYDGICSRQNFYDKLLKNPYRHSWFLLPIADCEDLIEDGFYHAIRRVRDDILTMAVTEKTAPVIMKALEFFANRHLGLLTQRIDQRTQSMSVNVSKRLGPGDAMDPEAMLQKYAEAKAKLVTAPRDVTEPDEPS